MNGCKKESSSSSSGSGSRGGSSSSSRSSGISISTKSSGSSSFLEEKEGENLSAKLKAATAATGDKTGMEIRKLEMQIRKAMDISKTIPETVRRLEALKAKEEKVIEKKARKEAVKTLDEHRRLMTEMSDHISKLRNKLNELVAKRSQLAASDARLRRELGQFSGSASGSGSSSSSGSQ